MVIPLRFDFDAIALRPPFDCNSTALRPFFYVEAYVLFWAAALRL